VGFSDKEFTREIHERTRKKKTYQISKICEVSGLLVPKFHLGIKLEQKFYFDLISSKRMENQSETFSTIAFPKKIWE